MTNVDRNKKMEELIAGDLNNCDGWIKEIAGGDMTPEDIGRDLQRIAKYRKELAAASQLADPSQRLHELRMATHYFEQQLRDTLAYFRRHGSYYPPNYFAQAKPRRHT